ncbi:unnamed protein product [Sphenostylis stenocarpa]|uniref:Uncharacterized protein n=1 Tax=Sphenostylis stenocarpa TaxID=92480 RepID=A0AA86VW68_9FABA|nr:unnamed protein product [Sphenostylis stenocarpa]
MSPTIDEQYSPNLDLRSKRIAGEEEVEMSKKGGSGSSFQKDVPWRASSSSMKPLPKIHHSPLLCVSQTPATDYAVSVMRHPDPIGSGLGDEAIVEAAGPDCLVPGQKMPLQLLGLQVWPIHVDLKFLEPVGRELKMLGKFMDDAVELMNKSFIER